MTSQFPELAHHEGSWMVTHKDNPAARVEVFDRARAKLLHSKGHHVQTIGNYLAELNQRIAAANKAGDQSQ